MQRLTSILCLTFFACSSAPSSETCQLAQNLSGIGDHNALSMNSMEMGQLSAQHAHPHQVAWNKLAQKGLLEQPLLEDAALLARSEEGKELLRYAVACALPAGEVIHVDNGIAALPLHGRLGVAPGWASGGLNVSEELALSACMLAHVNAFGRRVSISVRSDGIETSQAEREAFSVHEGAFFGSVSTQEFYSCYGRAPDARMYEKAPSRLDRVCTDGDGKCEIEALGACADICSDYTNAHGWSACRAPSGETFHETSNVFLLNQDLLTACE